MHKNKIKQHCETFDQHGRNKIRKRVILPLAFPQFLFFSLSLSLVLGFPFESFSISVSPYIFALCAFFDCMQCFFLMTLVVISTHCTYLFFSFHFSLSRSSQSCSRNYNFFYSARIYFLRNGESCLSLISGIELISQLEISLLVRVKII